MSNTVSQAKINARQALEKLGLTITSQFVPFSRSRNKDEKSPSLNWIVTVKHNGREVLTTDYSAGCAHAPSYKQNDKSIFTHNRVKHECEQGRFYAPYQTNDDSVPTGKKRIEPDTEDVFYSLVQDSSVLESGGFDNWASEYGYDTDSRKAEKTYQACVEIALKMQGAIGARGLAELREAFADY